MTESTQSQGTYKKTSPTNYYSIQNWMTHECGLRFPQRDIYAILHGFTQDRTQWVEPTQSYIAELVGISRQSVNENIAKLVEEGWIRKVTRIVPGRGTRSIYQTVTPAERKASKGGVNQDDTGCQPELQGVSTRVTGGVNQDDTDNKKIIKPISNTIINTHKPAQQAIVTPVATTSKIAEATPPCVDDDLETLFSQLERAYSKIKPFDGPKSKSRAKAKKALGRFLAGNSHGLSFDDLLRAVNLRFDSEQGKQVRYRTNLAVWLDEERYITDLISLKAYAHLKPGAQKVEKLTKTSAPASPERIAHVQALINGDQSISSDSSSNKIDANVQWPDKINCPKCGQIESAWHKTDNLYFCSACNKHVVLIA